MQRSQDRILVTHVGSLPRPAELEVYLGDAGIYCRPVQMQEQPVGAPGEEIAPAPGTPLYMF